MAEPTKKPAKSPFLAPLDASQLREFFRRLEMRPMNEQEAFIKRVNWNLLDAGTEYRLVSWLLSGALSGDEARFTFVLDVVGKLPGFRRARFAQRFAPLLERESPERVQALLRVFKRLRSPEPQSVARSANEPAKGATSAELARLKDFFGKTGKLNGL